ncbi:MAG: glutamine--fructose-6-phosphate transaminase (isomerizing), partial [Desulfobacteraceae bacterium]|nr:glutamine--fructose-6-phosphate transaminase (isomerizing) [Desulfobacteraceae bacterium]
ISNGNISYGKDVGMLAEVEQKQCLDKLSGRVGIGHVRWATHGGVTPINAHPHFDCKQQTAVVHNGIIENHEQLRCRLKRGHNIVSETDTEVIPHLIEEYVEMGASLEQAMCQTVKELRGSYAILAISASEPQKIVAARKDSPMVVGIGEGGNYIASDALCFLDATKRVLFIEDGDIVSMTREKVTILDSDGAQLHREPQEIDWKWDEATKQGYDFFMHKEIMEQPQAVRSDLMQDRHLITEMAMDILRARSVVFTGCGTSRHAALIGRYLFSKVGGKLSDVIIGSEFHHFSDSIDRNTVVIAVSQSGETADVIDGIKIARVAGGTILSIINRPNSMLEDLSQQTILLNCGFEVGVAATKSFISQIATFYLLSFSMVNKYGKARDQIISICNRIKKVQEQNHKTLVSLAQRFNNSSDFYYIARGINFAVASEAALKLKEISYIHAEGMPAGELKHGTLALVEKGTPVVVICPDDYTYDAVMNNAMEAKSRGAYIIAVSDRKSDIYDCWIRIPRVDELLYPMVAIVPLQLLAYHMAIARGCDPDKPRNLAKSVTVR